MDEREKLKQELLDELKAQYKMIPLKEARFNVADILERYVDELCEKCDIPNDYSNKQTIYMAIRKVLCIHFGVSQLRYVKKEDYENFRIEMERFIKEYLL